MSKCESCGMPAGVDCQQSCAYIFGPATVTGDLPACNGDHQFSVRVSVVAEGKNFRNKPPQTFWFNSVRCAEIFLMEHGYGKESTAVIGSGERLFDYLEPKPKPRRKKRAPNKTYLARLAVGSAFLG